jgi:uncharacterized membrane protein (DUF2068 family)
MSATSAAQLRGSPVSMTTGCVEAGLLAYGALFLAEGIGLVLRQRWGGAEARSS